MAAGASGDATQAELQSLGDSVGNAFPFVTDAGGGTYTSLGAEILLIAPGGEVVAAGTYASDFDAETIEAVLP